MSNKGIPKVSVLIPVFNAGKKLEKTLVSLKSQTFQDFEVIIVDDGSTDNTSEVALSVYNTAIIHHQENQGIAVALNNGLPYCKGEYIARIDCDDMAYPFRFQHQVEALETNPDFGVIGGHVLLYEIDGTDVGIVKFSTSPEEVLRNLQRKSPALLHEATMIRKSVLLQAGCYDPFFNGREDSELWLRLSLLSKLNNLDEVVVRSLSTTSGLSFDGLYLHPLIDLALQERDERKIYGFLWRNESQRKLTAENIAISKEIIQSPSTLRKAKTVFYRRRATFLFRSGSRLSARKEYKRALEISSMDIRSWIGVVGTYLFPDSVFRVIYNTYRIFTTIKWKRQ